MGDFLSREQLATIFQTETQNPNWTNELGQFANKDFLSSVLQLPGAQPIETYVISNNAITPSVARFYVDTEYSAATGSLRIINIPNTHEGMEIWLKPYSEARTVNLVSSSAQYGITLAANATEVALSSNYWIHFIRRGESWEEIVDVVTATSARPGIAQFATDAQATAGTATDRMINPKQLATLGTTVANTVQAINRNDKAATYTSAGTSATNTGFKLLNGTDIGALFGSIDTITVAPSGAGSFVTNVTANTSGKATTITKTLGNAVTSLTVATTGSTSGQVFINNITTNVSGTAATITKNMATVTYCTYCAYCTCDCCYQCSSN